MLYQALRAALEPYHHVYQLHGKTKRREYVLDTYTRTKKPCVLVASSIANDGLDIPDIASIIVAHGGKSFFQVIQRVGRGLRLAQDKDRLILVDFDDSALGKWFRNHAQERKKLYKGLGGTIHNIV
jgi:superfamily II DNA or RNA helicase